MKTDNPTERHIRHVLSNEPRTPQSPDDVRELLGTIDRLRNELQHERETNKKLAGSNVRLRAERGRLVEALEVAADELRCVATGNPCGTDTRPVVDGALVPCTCGACRADNRARDVLGGVG